MNVPTLFNLSVNTGITSHCYKLQTADGTNILLQLLYDGYRCIIKCRLHLKSIEKCVFYVCLKNAYSSGETP